MNKVRPVSYTHLDVYKRQAQPLQRLGWKISGSEPKIPPLRGVAPTPPPAHSSRLGGHSITLPPRRSHVPGPGPTINTDVPRAFHPHELEETMAKIAAELLVERLIDWGVDTVFGIPGDGINGITEGLRRNQDKIRCV